MKFTATLPHLPPSTPITSPLRQQLMSTANVEAQICPRSRITGLWGPILCLKTQTKLQLKKSICENSLILLLRVNTTSIVLLSRRRSPRMLMAAVVELSTSRGAKHVCTSGAPTAALYQWRCGSLKATHAQTFRRHSIDFFVCTSSPIG